jgi:hypothetical protein
MKKLLFVLITLSIFMSACSNKEVKEEKRELTPIANKTYKDYPDWVLQPDYENGIAAVGQAKIGSYLYCKSGCTNQGSAKLVARIRVFQRHRSLYYFARQKRLAES